MPFEILVRISLVIATSIYSRELSKVHSTRHVPNLQKYLSDETLVIPLDENRVPQEPHLRERTIVTMDREVKRTQQRRFPLVEVRWNTNQGPGVTWECENQSIRKYPHFMVRLFVPTPCLNSNFGTKFPLTGGWCDNRQFSVKSKSTKVNKSNRSTQFAVSTRVTLCNF